jgi:hypothetical protein
MMPRADLTIPRTAYVGAKMTGTLDLRSQRRAKAAERRAAQDAKTTAPDQQALDHWFAVSGTTMADLDAAITRWQPGDHPADAMGIHPEIIIPVMEYPQLHPNAKILIIRAMQTVAIRQNTRKLAAAHAPQPDLFV